MSTTLDAFGNRIDNCGVIAGDTSLDLIITSDASRNLILKNGADNIFSGIGAKAYFVFPPECNIAPTTPDQMANKAYVDGVIPSTPTLAQVMTAGNTMNQNLNTDGNAIVNVGDIAGASDKNVLIYSAGNRELIFSNGNTGIFTCVNSKAFFLNPPECNIAPTFPDQFTNKAYVDSVAGGGTGSVGTLSQVLTAGNDAGANSITNLLSVVGTQLPGVAALPLSIYSGTGDLVLGTATNQNAITVENTSGIATFNALPLCSVSPTADSQLVNKAYVNYLISALARTGADCIVNGVDNTVYRNVWMDGAYWNVADFVNGGAFFMTTWGTETNPRFDILLVGGGGAGGGGASGVTQAGGGGAGAVVILKDVLVRAEYVQGISVSIGAGGIAGSGTSGGSGGDTSIIMPSSIDINQTSTTYLVGGGGGGGAGITTVPPGRPNGAAAYTNPLMNTTGIQIAGGCGGGGASSTGTTGGALAGSVINAFTKIYRGFFANATSTAGGNGDATNGGGGGGGASFVGGAATNSLGAALGGVGGSGIVLNWTGTQFAFGVGGSGGRAQVLGPYTSQLSGIAPNMNGARGAHWNGSAWVAATSPIQNTGSGGGGAVNQTGVRDGTNGAKGRVMIRFRS